jgi:small subunit ribosomal protein S15
MALTKEEKTKEITSYRRDDKDTGSVEVQVALLTKKIKKLTVHMTNNDHDFSSKRGMDILIARRKNLLNYLKRTDLEKYNALVKKIKDEK